MTDHSESYRSRLDSLRAWLRAQQVPAFLLPLADAYLSEYPPPAFRRLEWLTGFSGSAGMAVVLAEEAMTAGAPAAALFSDGRYTLQMQSQVDASLFALHNNAEMTPAAWLAKILEQQDKTAPPFLVAYDPALHTKADLRRLESALTGCNVRLRALTVNPVDVLWTEHRPPVPAAPVMAHPVTYAGETVDSKRARLAASLRERHVVAAVIAAPDSVMWLLNLRGGDVPMTPVALCHAVLHADGRVWLYLDAARLAAGAAQEFGAAVELRPPARLTDDLRGFRGVRVLYDPTHSNAWIYEQLNASGAVVVEGDDPCILPKACKNAVELEGMRAAHMRDGLAVTRFLYWLEEMLAGQHNVTEMDVMEKLEGFRRAGLHYQGPSFTTIAGSGPNGAIVHYHSTEATNRIINWDGVLLLDSGGQYLDGTTDITRTILTGAPPEGFREDFTRVLQGHIALACARFPEGTSGGQLDALARAPLWACGKDYDHGTGHGVGAFLGVHEGPQRIGKRGSDVPLRAGMILSNEPGYYKTGAYGIRIENLVAVVEAAAHSDAQRRFFEFETVTLVPIDTRAVKAEWLSDAERAWLNAYHARVLSVHRHHLTASEREWLEARCTPL